MAVAGGVLAHIRHAEEWLKRARRDYERGNVRKAVLRLLLAEAEIRQARESSAAMDEPTRRRRSAVPWMVLGSIATAGVIVGAYAVLRPPAVGPMVGEPRPAGAVAAGERRETVLQFDSGQVLPFVGFPVGIRSGRVPAEPALGTGVDPLFEGTDGPTLVTFH